MGLRELSLPILTKIICTPLFKPMHSISNGFRKANRAMLFEKLSNRTIRNKFVNKQSHRTNVKFT